MPSVQMPWCRVLEPRPSGEPQWGRGCYLLTRIYAASDSLPSARARPLETVEGTETQVAEQAGPRWPSVAVWQDDGGSSHSAWQACVPNAY